MSDLHSEAASIDEDDFFSARGSNEIARKQYEDHSIWDNESTDGGPAYTAFQSLPSGVEHEAWRGEVDDEDAPDLVGVGQEIEPAVAVMEALEGLILSNAEGAPTPVYPTAISDETDVLQAEENPWDAETVISRVASEPPSQEPMSVDVRPTAGMNGIAQPVGGVRHPGISFQPTHGSGSSGRDGTQRRDGTSPRPTSSRPRNRSRDHTGSTVRFDSVYVLTPRTGSNESQLYKGFCWGWKPSWWPESWRWPDTTR